MPVRFNFCAVRLIFWAVRFIFGWFDSFFAVLIFCDRFSFFCVPFILFILDLKILSVTERHTSAPVSKQNPIRSRAHPNRPSQVPFSREVIVLPTRRVMASIISDEV